MRNLFILIAVLYGFQLQSQTKAEKKAHKEEKANLEYQMSKQLITSGSFLFVADRAMPMGGGSISMVTNINQLEFKDGTADIYLPYFGTVWGGGGFNHQPEFKFKGIPDNYTVEFDDDKRKIEVRFDLKNGSEIHNVVVTTGNRGYTSVHIKSGGRSSITYNGYIKSNSASN